MLTFIFTIYRFVALVLGVIGIPVTLIWVFAAARALGAGGQAADDGRMSERERKITFIAMGVAWFTAFNFLVGALANIALQPSNQRIDNVILSLFVGHGYNPQRLVIFATLFFIAGLVLAMVIGTGLADGGPIRDFVQNAFKPSTHRGDSGSAHLATPSQFTYLQRQFLEPEQKFGLVMRGEFYGIDSPNQPKHRVVRIDKTLGRKYRGMLQIPLKDQVRGTVLIGPPGTGKSQSGILPTAAEAMRSGQSLIVLDPQNELEPYLVDFCRVTDHLLIVHDPTDPTVDKYNLAGGLHRPEDAQSIANVILKGGGGDPFWIDSARNLMAACMFVFPTLGEMLNALSDMKSLADTLESHPVAKGLAAAWINDARLENPKTAPGVISQMTASILANWANPTVQEATSTSDFDPSILVEQPSVLILRCPGKYMNVYGPYLGAVLERFLNELESLGQETQGGKLKRPIKIIIDEFPVIGKAQAVLKSVNTVRKRNISFLVAFQTKAQLDLIYGRDGANAMLTGFAIQIIFGSTDHDTAFYASRLAGKSTVNIESRSQGERSHVTIQTRQRDLLTPDEVIRPAKGNCIVFFRRAEEAYAEQMVFYAALRRMYRLDWWQNQIEEARAIGLEPSRLTEIHQTAQSLFAARVVSRNDKGSEPMLSSSQKNARKTKRRVGGYNA